MMNPKERRVSLFSRRSLLIKGAMATAGLNLIGEAGAQEATGGTQPGKASDSSITLQIYKGFSENRLDL